MKNLKSQDFDDFASRPEEEMGKALEKLRDQLWYNRHRNLCFNIEQGFETVDEEIWKAAQQSAERLRSKYAACELGPWTDFEWGMINGKLSALQWALGEDWDVLDT